MKPDDWPRTAKNTKKQDNGKLPLHILEPKYLADPNHRKKVIGKQLYALANSPQKVSKIDKALAQRLKDYWGVFLKQIRNLDIETDAQEIIKRSNAPVEHVFNEHKYCSKTWCYVL